METAVQERCVKVAFQKLIPDWIYLLFKLKSRISDRSWKDLIKLTTLGRRVVRFCFVSDFALSYHISVTHILIFRVFKHCKAPWTSSGRFSFMILANFHQVF